MMRFERTLSPKTFEVSKCPHTPKNIFRNNAGALRVLNEIFGRFGMVLVAIFFFRSDRTPGTNEIGGFKRTLVGYGKVLRSEGL